MSNTQTKPWYKELQSKLSTLAEQFDLDPIQAEQFRETMFSVCRAEYMAGNRSGIAWAYKQVREKGGNMQPTQV